MVKIGFAMTASYCVFSNVIPQIRSLVDAGFDVTPLMSDSAYSVSTRFGEAEAIQAEVESITGHKIIHTIPDAEPIGPKKLFDALIVAPCTGNTLGKLSYGINDTAVTMAVKGQLRNERPVILAVSTNDALGVSAKNIGTLQSRKNIYFVPMKQDDPFGKPTSVVANFSLIRETTEHALKGKQIQPVWRLWQE